MSEPDDRAEDRADRAPGDAAEGDAGHWVRNANLGLGFSVVLTLASFGLLRADLIWAPAIPVGLLVLAVAQMGVHLVFFLHVTTGPDNTNNVLALAFGLLVTLLIVVGSVWIMGHLAANMMPMEQLTRMQQ
jgi:cytochrome o ubiquinol oxidase operon protein cyoD